MEFRSWKWAIIFFGPVARLGVRVLFVCLLDCVIFPETSHAGASQLCSLDYLLHRFFHFYDFFFYLRSSFRQAKTIIVPSGLYQQYAFVRSLWYIG